MTPKSALLFTLLSLLLPSFSIAKPQLIIDADTANEIDDAFAIVRLFWSDKYEIVGLNSTQWFHRGSGDQTVFQSQSLNEEIIRLTDRSDVTPYLGSNSIFGNWWGGTDPADSPAAQNIIARARALPVGEKLTVVCLGAFTNLASAVALAPDIVPKLAAYVIGFRYDDDRSVWNKNEFNVLRDFGAADVLLNQTGLELHIMTATVASAMQFDRDESWEKLRPKGTLGEFLAHRWHMNKASLLFERWTMWDLAIIAAMIHPEFATEKQVATPLENTPRQVWIYHTIDAERIMQDFWQTFPDA